VFVRRPPRESSAREEGAERKRQLRPEVCKREDFVVVSVVGPTVGRGRPATVVLWRERVRGEVLAAKVCQNPPAKWVDRVANEARLLLTLSDPSLVRELALFLRESPGECAVILMQNCLGGSVTEQLERGSLRATEKNRANVSLAKGQAFLDGQHILDGQAILPAGWKPSNVLFDEVGAG
jgi:serine/threonine protein kinase